jgi:hypothetical protein
VVFPQTGPDRKDPKKSGDAEWQSDRHCRIPTATVDHPSTLSCSIQYVSLDDHEISYKALSYTWGPPKFDQTILINGKSMSITFSRAGPTAEENIKKI